MSERNKETIRRMFEELINQQNLDVVDELFDPDFQGDMPSGPLDREAFKGFVRSWLAAFPDAYCEVYDLIAEGDKVALNIAEMRDGRGYRHKVIMDLPTLMAQLGAGPSREPAGAI